MLKAKLTQHILPLGGKHYHSLPINPLLAPYIRQIELNIPSSQNYEFPQPYRILPDIYPVMGIQTSGRLYLWEDTKSKLLSRSGISGLQTNPRIFQASELITNSILIRFYPWAVTVFFHDAASQFSNLAISIGDIIGNNTWASLEEEFFFSEDPLAMSDLIQEFLIKCLLTNRHKLPQPRLIALIKELKSQSEPSIEKLAKDYGFSKRNLERYFQTYIGLSPKKFALITRFQKVVQGLRVGYQWQDLAEELGYYDQAHFINEFKLFSGLTPTQFLKNIE